jgi:CHAT domain-containing protein/tetratricopeptide (TPR) repeat protein
MRKGFGIALSTLLFCLPVQIVLSESVQAQSIQDRMVEAYRSLILGNQQIEKSQYQEALQSYQSALENFRAIKDRKGEGSALIGLGNTYGYLEQYQKAIDFSQQSLEISKQIGDLLGEGASLNNLADTYESLGQYQKAIDFYQQAIAIFKQISNQNAEGRSLGNLGIAYIRLGQYEKAINFFQQSLAIAKQIGDLHVEAGLLNSLGNAYKSLGQYQKAIDFFQQSLAIAKQFGDRQGEAMVFIGLGGVYNDLGQDQKAIDFYQQTLEIAKQISNREGEGAAFNNLGNSYYSLGQDQKAIYFFQQSLAIKRQLGDRNGEGNALNNLGNAYRSLGQDQKAIDFYQQSLEIAKQIGNRQGEGNALGNLGIVYDNLGQDQKAIDFYQQSLAIKRQIGNRHGEGNTLNNLGLAFVKLNQPELAILFYKQSINVTELIRKDIRRFSKEEQKSYLSTVEKTYRSLADLLLKQDRILEAQQVLDLLKVQELSEYLRSETIGDSAQKADYQPPEQNIIALSNELAELQKLDREGKLDPQQQPRLAFLTNNEKEYNKQFNAFLQNPAVQKEIQELRRTQSAQNVDIQKYNRLRGNLSKLQNAALFYPLVLEDRLELILIIANAPPIRKTINLKRTDLNQAIASFLSNLRNPNSEVKPDAQKFYNWLIQPFEKELQQANIQTIIYAPDEGLRYIPLAALYNGKQWLVERYRINNITAASLTDFTPRAASSIRVLAAASSAKHDVKVGDRTLSFSPLPATKLEVDNIATKINTTKLVDRDFTEPALTGKLNTHNIIHLATHGHFEVGQPEQSFILLGDGKISTISDIGSWTLTNVSLVVLSACETAIGGQGGKGKGIEIFGLGYQIHNAGASAAIATLWKVSDGGTERLMDAFYTAVKTGKVANTEALRQAQVAMITGNYEGLGEARGIVSIEARPRTTSAIPAKISHPYYWAAFILIGNGL